MKPSPDRRQDQQRRGRQFDREETWTLTCVCLILLGWVVLQSVLVAWQ